MLVLFLYIVTNNRLVQTYCAHTIAARPKTTTKKRTFSPKKYTMNSNRTFAFKIPYRHRYTILRRNTQQHMKVIGGRIAFQQPNIFLSAQFTNNLADRFAMFFKVFLFPVLWYNHHVILTFPFYMGLTLPIFHFGSPCPFGPSSGEPLYKRWKRQSLINSHRQSRWIKF